MGSHDGDYPAAVGCGRGVGKLARCGAMCRAEVAENASRRVKSEMEMSTNKSKSCCCDRNLVASLSAGSTASPNLGPTQGSCHTRKKILIQNHTRPCPFLNPGLNLINVCQLRIAPSASPAD